MATVTPQSLTAHLLEVDPEKFQTATRARFLEKAGGGSLSKEILEQWLPQDRLYAQAYIRFASLLLANLPLPSSVSPNHMNERLVDLVIGAITNVRRELKFFEAVAGKYGLALEAKTVSTGVQMYQSLFSSIGQEIEQDKRSLLDGFVLLWATEKCYLDAWTYASSFASSSPPEQDRDGGALRKEFIPNWSSKDFKKFVDECAEAADGVWVELQDAKKRELLMRGNWLEVGKDQSKWLESMKQIWMGVLEAEIVFWPNVDDN